MSDSQIFSMWSGPRNISTAMMRSFASRPDCEVVDEPFYAYYLNRTGLDHPMRKEILQSQSQDWQTVSEEINSPLSSGKSLRYLKHMTQHMLDEIDLSRFNTHLHCFLIRSPDLVVASFAAKYDNVTAEATGFKQQRDLFNYFKKQTGKIPVVVEGEDIQKDPAHMLAKLCKACNLPFSEKMLCWEKGAQPEDGVWGTHWYGAVEASTGFAPYQDKSVQLSFPQQKLVDELMPYYEELRQSKITL
ncbi:MAG: hypothetical protein MI743_03985 [Sneathiellales bacterium]|nr:hypothetical protein [Sneathiellales bacterium]